MFEDVFPDRFCPLSALLGQIGIESPARSFRFRFTSRIRTPSVTGSLVQTVVFFF